MMNNLSAKTGVTINVFLVSILCVCFNAYAKQDSDNNELFFNGFVAPKIQPSSDLNRVLFVGNSFSFYNNGIHNYLSSLIRSSGQWNNKQNRFRLSTLSGGHINDHSAGLKDLLSNPSANWQAIVLQGHSDEPINPKKNHEFVRATAKAVQQIKAKGIKPILFMTWGYKGQAQMAENIAKAYINLANKLDILVIPVGLAFARAESLLSNIELFVPDVLGIDSSQQLTYRKDWKHPSEAGTYLAACVFYSAFYQRSPEGLVFTGKLDKDTALALQKLSWQVTQQFYSRG